MAHFNFVISQNAKWGHAGFYIDCYRMTVPENILLQKSTVSTGDFSHDFSHNFSLSISLYCLFSNSSAHSYKCAQ